MKLQIKKLFFVQRKTHLVKEWEFELNKLNLVTGRGAQGKSTVWTAIDYVFGAEKCYIDYKIVKAVAWVGLMIETSGGRYVVAREVVEDIKTGSNACYLKHLAEEVGEISGSEITANSTVSAVKGVLNRVCGIETMIEAANNKGDLITFSIRYLLNYIGQDYDTIANQNRLFYYVAPVPWGVLSKYFATVIGVNAETLNLLNGKKQADEKALKKLKEEYKKALAISDDWKRELKEQLFEAKRLTMLDSGIDIPNDVEKCLSLVRSIVETEKVSPVTTYNVEILGDLAERVAKNESKKAELELQIAEIQVRIQELEKMEKNAADIHSEALKIKDRLEIGKWLEANWGEKEPGFFNYPYSQGRIADDVRREIKQLGRTLRRYEETALSNKKMMTFRTLSRAEVKKLKEQQAKKSAAVAALRDEIEGMKSQGESEKRRLEEYETVSNRAKELVGNLKRTIEFVEKLTATGDFNVKIQQLEAAVEIDVANIEKEKARVRARQSDVIEEISDRAFEIAKSIDLDKSFQFAHITFDTDELDFRIQEGDGEYYLSSRRSTSNHIPFHVGITAAMEEVSAGNDAALLPDFAVFDQPSQGRSGESGERCFLRAVTELSKSVSRTLAKRQQAWQPILIDVWGKRTLAKLGDDVQYKHIDLDVEGGLVPQEWMERA